MKTRPILFKSEMVKAILDGRKTQTRRVIKFIKPEWEGKVINPAKIETAIMYSGNEVRFYDDTGCWTYTRSCPYGWFGDFLWVRETWRNGQGGIEYRADRIEHNVPLRWKSSIHLRKKDSRITLKITYIRVENLQQLSREDFLAEGIPQFTRARGVLSDNPPDPRWKFIELWDSINAKKGYGWDNKPWVWVIGFERIEDENQSIDTITK